VLAQAGFDFLVIDLEHGPFHLDRVHEYVNACEGALCSPIVRISHAPWKFRAATSRLVVVTMMAHTHLREKDPTAPALADPEEAKGWRQLVHALGDRVGIAWIFSACGKCKFCLAGDENLCASFQATGRDADGGKLKHYYPVESVGIATGLLITALHAAGLATLTHTPSPMGFLNEILGRPADTDRPFLLLVAGHPAPTARVPAIRRRPLEAICTWY